MVINKLVSGLLLLFISACIAGEITPELSSESKGKTEFELFQNYTLATCMAHAYQAGEIYSDSVAALNGYRARAKVPLAAYRQVNSIVVKWLAKPSKTKMGKQTEIAVCIDLSKSQELAQLFTTFDPCQDKAAWRDKNEFNMRCP